MFCDIYENVNKYRYNPLDERIINLLQQTWSSVSVDYIRNYLKRRRCFENISEGDICRVELYADEVRSVVYTNIQIMEHQYPDVVNEWFDLSVEQQNSYLIKAFPSTQVYGV